MSQPASRSTRTLPDSPSLANPDRLTDGERTAVATDPAEFVSSGLPGHERPVLGRSASDRRESAYDIPPPTRPVGPRFAVPFALAQLGLFVALLGPVTVSMAIKVSAIVGEDDATSAQGIVLGVGALAALVANPIFGRLSDRTTSRWGRRRPWMIGGSVGLAFFLLVIALAGNVPTLIVAWFCAQLAANACFAAYLSTIADQVPPGQHAKVSALGGVMQNVGILAAIWIAGLFTTNMLAMFMVPAAIGVLGMVIYSAVLPDRRLHHRPAKQGWRDFARTFWVSPTRYPDFAWAWISRFLLILGSFMFSSFRFFWMKDRLGLDDEGAAAAIFTGVLIYTIVLVVVGQAAGYLSDRIQRRKVFVFGSTALFAVGLGLLTQVNSVSGFYLVEAILGAAYGIYMGVDLALVLEVLPNPADSAKDLGVFNIANAGPQSLAPFLGAVLIGGAAKNYDLLYVTAAALTLLGALAIVPVRKVK